MKGSLLSGVLRVQRGRNPDFGGGRDEREVSYRVKPHLAWSQSRF